ncbi:hypothetical protein [Virgibacillus ihumii]|nr:hypothetical protein [Virgibacillus ihumii]
MRRKCIYALPPFFMGGTSTVREKHQPYEQNINRRGETSTIRGRTSTIRA